MCKLTLGKLFKYLERRWHTEILKMIYFHSSFPFYTLHVPMFPLPPYGFYLYKNIGKELAKIFTCIFCVKLLAPATSLRKKVTFFSFILNVFKLILQKFKILKFLDIFFRQNPLNLHLQQLSTPPPIIFFFMEGGVVKLMRIEIRGHE